MKVTFKKITTTFVIFLFLACIFISCNANKATAQETKTLAQNNLSEVQENPTNEKKMQVVFELNKDLPQNHGVNAEKLQNFVDSIKNTEITSNIIVKDGVIISEYFKEGYDNTSVFSVQSCSKSITSAITGIAIAQGYIPDVNAPMTNYIDVSSYKNKEQLEKITLRQLLTNTSGLTSTDTAIWNDWRMSDNWVDYLFTKPILHKAGAVFEYSTGNTHLISAMIQKATGKTLYEYGKAELFSKVGMNSVICSSDAQGISDGGNGFSLTSYDMAKFGLLYLNKGVFNGEQIIPKEWIEESTKIQLPNVANYGYQWWIRWFGSKAFKSYFAHGWGEQVIAVIPSANMVVVFTSRYANNNKNKIYWQYITDIVNAGN